MNDTIVTVVSEDHCKQLVAHALKVPAGDFVEVGVFQGGTALYLMEVARTDGRRLHLFDTFCGIPYQELGDSHMVGDFADTDVERVRELLPDAMIYQGIFPDTYFDDEVGPIALAHIDCDQYRSVKACIDHLGPAMVPGGIMVFDDYGLLDGATRAVRECFPPERILGGDGNNSKAYVVF